MIMLGIYATGEIPFQTVYLHGLVRDGNGQKMAKSKGNVINPHVMCDKYGTDAFRMSLVYGTAAGNDMALSEDKVRGMRNFSNKLWNIGRFIYLNQEALGFVYDGVPLSKRQPEDINIMKKLMYYLDRKVTKSIEQYKFGQAAETLYEFIWHTFADKYIEKVKERLKQKDEVALATLVFVYSRCLTHLHPFMPFITEEINKQLFGEKAKPLIVTTWPKT